MRSRLFFILGTIALMAAAGNVQAQSSTGSSISLGPEVVFPLHSTSHGYESEGIYRSGGGLSAKFELPLLDELKFTFSAAYQFYIPTNKVYDNQVYYTCLGCAVPTQPPVDNNAYEYIPLTVGLTEYLFKNFFISIEAGDAIKAGDKTLSSFIYGSGLGGDIPINKHNFIELSAGTLSGFKSFDYDYPVSQIYLKAAYKYSF